MIPVDDVVIFDVITHVFATGAVSDADSAPTFEVFEEDTDTAILTGQTMTKRTSKTGNYRGSITCSAANGFEAGKWYSVVVSATVSSVSGKCVAKHFRVSPAESSAGVPKTDLTHISGSAVSTSTAQLGVNAVQAGGTAWASGAITAASIAADAITDAKVASDVTIASVTGAVGSVTGSVGSIATGGIVAASFAAGAIDAAAIAADAIGSSELAASAITEIQSGLSTLDAAGIRTAVGLASANLDTQLSTIDDFLDTEVAAIKAKTDNLPSDPADASDIAASFATVNATLATVAGYLDTEIAAIKAKTDNLPASPAATADITTALETTLADSIPADGTRPTIKQALYMLTQFMLERSVSGTTMTVKKADGTTTLMTLTLGSATEPTSITRAT